MKTIICKFMSDDKDIKKTMVINDSLTELSKSKKNEATEILEPGQLDYGMWSVFFEISETLSYEVVFKFDEDNYQKTLNPLKAITWSGDDPDKITITDVQNVTVKIK